MTSVCIISNEVYPVHKGGIGRLMYNFAVRNQNSKHAVDLHFLFPSKLLPDAAPLESTLADLATVHYCPEELVEIGSLGSAIQSFDGKDALDRQMVESLRYYSGLLAAQTRCGFDFDFVEFPDFGGWGTASIAAKRAGMNFQNTLIAVRLHSTFSLIMDHEPFVHEPSEWVAAICDMERAALRDADIVIAHLASTAKLNADRFGLSADWMRKVRIELPPIMLAEPELKALDDRSGGGFDGPSSRNFLFSSRLQEFKRPDIFIRAAVRFLDLQSNAENLFLIASYGWNTEYIDWLKQLVPARWRDNIIFLDALNQEERAKLMLDSILVIPSDFESLCLLAYEGRLLGVKLILNRRCLAFGAEPGLWQDGSNCLFFDGDFVNLAQVMQRSIEWSSAPPEIQPARPPYWEHPPSDLIPTGAQQGRALSLGFVLIGSSNLEELGSMIQRLQLESESPEIIVIAPRQAFELAGVPASVWESFGIGVHLTSWLDPTPTEIASVISTFNVEAVAFVWPDMQVERTFWMLAREGLGTHRDAAVFTSHLGTHDVKQPYVLNYGDAPNISLLTDRIAHRASVFRRDALNDVGIRELAGDRWYEDVCGRLLNAEYRIIVAPATLVTYVGPPRYSRINSACFFATQSEESLRTRRFPFHRTTAIKPIDSISSVTNEDWIAKQAEKQRRLFASTRASRDDVLRFDDLELKSASTDAAGQYSEIEIVLRGLGIGRMSASFLGFKLSQYRGISQLEFREAGNAGQVFATWPPSTSDKWGPVAVWSAGSKSHPHGIFFEHAPESDIRKLRLLVENLPAIIALLPLPAEDQAGWIEVAKSLSASDETVARDVEALAIS